MGGLFSNEQKQEEPEPAVRSSPRIVQHTLVMPMTTMGDEYDNFDQCLDVQPDEKGTTLVSNYENIFAEEDGPLIEKFPQFKLFPPHIV